MSMSESETDSGAAGITVESWDDEIGGIGETAPAPRKRRSRRKPKSLQRKRGPKRSRKGPRGPTTIMTTVYLLPTVLARLKVYAMERNIALTMQRKMVSAYVRSTRPVLPGGVVNSHGASGVINQLLTEFFEELDAKEEQIRRDAKARRKSERDAGQSSESSE